MKDYAAVEKAELGPPWPRATINPKQTAGRAKAPVHHIPPAVIQWVGYVMKNGADKYGAFNWGEAGVTASDYYDALWRHMSAWYCGEDLDQDSKAPHLAHAIATLCVLMDSQMMANMVDDRPNEETMDVSLVQDEIRDMLDRRTVKSDPTLPQTPTTSQPTPPPSASGQESSCRYDTATNQKVEPPRT